MSDAVDFSMPYWLIYYFHVIGIVSLVFDAFSIYLILFKSNQIDNFRFFLLNFQVSCQFFPGILEEFYFQIACCFTDIHITFLIMFTFYLIFEKLFLIKSLCVTKLIV